MVISERDSTIPRGIILCILLVFPDNTVRVIVELVLVCSYGCMAFVKVMLLLCFQFTQAWDGRNYLRRWVCITTAGPKGG